MKSIFSTILFLVVVTSSIAQEKKAHIQLAKYDVLIGRIFLPNQNLFIITRPIVGSPDMTIRCFSSEGDETWKKVVPTKGNLSKTNTFTVASPDGNFIYIILQQDNGYDDKAHHIWQFSKTGQEKKFEIKGREEFGSTMLKVFCDNNYLYYLASENGDEKSDRKKASDKLILNRFSKDDFTYKRFVLALPPIEASDKSTFWSLIGQRGEEKFLTSKYIDKEAGKSKFTIVTITPEGEVTKTTTIETTLSDKYTRPSYSTFENPWEHEAVQLDYTLKEGSQPPQTGMFYDHLLASEGAFGHILYNEAHDNFYVYGFTGPKPFRNVGPVYDGFYVHKFDREGQLVWKLQQPASTQLKGENYFRVHATPAERKLAITSLVTKGLRVDIEFQKVQYTYLISEEGKPSDLPKKEGNAVIRGIISTDRNLKSAAYIAKNKDKNVSISLFEQTANELIMKYDDKEYTIDLMLFK